MSGNYSDNYFHINRSEKVLENEQKTTKKHKNLTIVILIIIALFIFAGIPLLVFLLTHDVAPSPTNQLNVYNETYVYSNGVSDEINPFTKTSVLTDPNPSVSSRFGDFVFAHDQGFLVVTRTTLNMPTYLLFYQTTNDTINKLHYELTLDVTIEGKQAVICDGTFIPSLGVIDEILYLVLALGVTYPGSAYAGYKFGRELHFYTYDTNASASQVWVKSPIRKSHPYFQRPSNLDPWLGCFGNSIQGVLDDSSSTPKQSLYVSSTITSIVKQQPSEGGSVFWFVFESNSTNIALSTEYEIKDAKLLILNESEKTPLPNPLLSNLEYAMNGFGASFAVQSGRGASDVVVVANWTNQDTVKNTCGVLYNAAAPSGYIQIYRKSDTVGWEQSNQKCESSSAPAEDLNKQIFYTRFVPNTQIDSKSGIPADPFLYGFGYGLAVVGNFLITSVSASAETTPPEGSPDVPSDSYTLSFNLTDGKQPLSQFSHHLGLIKYSAAQLDTTPDIPTNRIPFNRPLFMVGDTLLCVVSKSTNKNVDTIGLFSTVEKEEGTSKSLPFTFKDGPVQLIGKDGSGGSSVEESRIGFGQFAATWRSPSQIKTYLAINDPLAIVDASAKHGRVYIFTQTNQ